MKLTGFIPIASTFALCALGSGAARSADGLAIHEGMKATVHRAEPCFNYLMDVDSYWTAKAKNDTETLRSFTDGGTMPPILLKPGTHVRFLDGGGIMSTPRLVIEDGPRRGDDCYVRDQPPVDTYSDIR